MSYGSPGPDSRFIRALVRSSRADAPRVGAMARARVRLGVGDRSSALPFGVTGALLVAVMAFARGWSPSSGAIDMASERTVTDCRGGVEAPPCSCNEPSRAAVSGVTISGSSSGTALSRGSSGG